MLPFRRNFCVHHSTMHQVTVSLHSKPHRWVYVCLGVTCRLHFWQNDRGLLRATVVTRVWNRYRNKSQHSKLTLEENILPPLLPGPFDHESDALTTEISPLPSSVYLLSLTCLSVAGNVGLRTFCFESSVPLKLLCVWVSAPVVSK